MTADEVVNRGTCFGLGIAFLYTLNTQQWLGAGLIAFVSLWWIVYPPSELL